MKRITSLWLTLLFALGLLGGCAQDVGVIGGADGPTDIIVSEEGGEQAAQGGEAVSPEDLDLGPAVTGIETIAADSGAVTEDGSYNTRDTVALYLMRYGTLPQNFITKSEAQALGWEGGSLMDYAPGKSIGGDHFGNYEGALPEADGRSYTECDIDTGGDSGRGAKRLVFSSDGLIFYTDDHYETFTLLLGDEQDAGAAA